MALRPLRRKGDKGRVRKDDIGRHAQFFGDPGPLGAQRIEQSLRLAGKTMCRFLRPSRLLVPATRFRPILAKEDLPLAFEDRPRLVFEFHRAESRMIDGDEAVRQQLPEDRLPGARRNILSGAENGHIDMAEPLRLVIDRAHQHIDHMTRAETLTGAIDRRQRLDCCFRAVPGLHRFQAGIAIAATAAMRLAEMRKNGLSPAAGRFADGEQRIELSSLHALDLFGCITLIDHAPPLDDIGHAVSHPNLGR